MIDTNLWGFREMRHLSSYLHIASRCTILRQSCSFWNIYNFNLVSINIFSVNVSEYSKVGTQALRFLIIKQSTDRLPPPTFPYKITWSLFIYKYLVWKFFQDTYHQSGRCMNISVYRAGFLSIYLQIVILPFWP